MSQTETSPMGQKKKGKVIMMTYNFTSRAKKAIEIANDAALELGHRYIGTEHLLYGLAKEGSGVASKVLENQEITPENIIDVTN